MASKSGYALYEMEHNHFWDEAIVVIRECSEKEIEQNGLTGKYIAIYIKPKRGVRVEKIDDIVSKDIFDKEKNVFLRIASECQFGLFGDSHCDCESQRIASLEHIKKNGQGIYVVLPQEAQGHGLLYKAKELQIQVRGLSPDGENIGKKDIYEAAKYLNGDGDLDIRGFKVIHKIVTDLKLNRYTYSLISSNPKKSKDLREVAGLKIERMNDVNGSISLNNVGEYLAKIYKKDFMVSQEQLQEIYNILLSAKEIPDRTLSLLRYIEDDINIGKEFQVDMRLLKKISSVHQSKPNIHSKGRIFDFSKTNAYRDYQIEIKISLKNIDVLFREGLLINILSLRFEENYFYDLIYFRDLPTRDLKIRRAFRLNDRKKAVDNRLIYKVATKKNLYYIRNIAISTDEVVSLLAESLNDYEEHYVPVFTQECETDESFHDLTILIKRYSSNLRTLSIMGSQKEALDFLKRLKKIASVREVPDPTNFRSIDKKIGLGFDYDILAKQELKLFKKYHKG